MVKTATQPVETSATRWQIDPAHTQVEFEVRHMMLSKVRGRFESVEGTLVLGSEGDPGASRAEAVIMSSSLNSGQAQRDQHLRSPDFLDVERFPQLRFQSTSVVRGRDGHLKVAGALTIHGVTRGVDLDVTESGRGRDPWGKERVGFSATTTLDRRDFGLTWNQALEAGGILVGNDVRITLEIQAVLLGDD